MGLFKKKAATAGGEVGTDAVPTADTAPQPTRSGKKVRMSVEELRALRGEMSELRTRLEAAEKAKWTVEHRLNALDAATTTLAGDKTVVAELATKVHTLELQVGLAHDPEATSTDDDTPVSLPSIPDLGSKLAGLELRLAELQARLDTPPSPVLQPRPLLPSSQPAEPSPTERERLERLETLAQRLAAVDELTARVGELGERVNTLAQQATRAEPDPDIAEAIQAAVAAAGVPVDDVAAQIAQLAERLTATDAAARQTSEQVTAIEQRLNSISTELANQISELGREIDGFGGAGDATGVDVQVIEALRAGQVKLANEQARYEIAFRHDLAALAEQVRQATRPR